MRWIVRNLLGLVILALLLSVVALFLPREVKVARSTVINAPPEAIFPHINAMDATQAWSPWLAGDPDTVVVIEGPGSGVGNKMTWASEVRSVGSGTQEIIASAENELVETAVEFGRSGAATARFDLMPLGESTEVTWGFVTDTGYNPIARWIGLGIDGWVGDDYEDGLARLKALVEGG